MKSDKPTVVENLFRPSGALGPFSTKIDVAYLLDVLSPEAYKDLTNVKNIRNDFAHDLNLDSFEAQSVTDRCKNFVLIERHVGPIPSAPPDTGAPVPAVARPSPYLGLPDYKEKLLDARFRYVMTAQLISHRLGEGADSPTRTLPLI
jgi:hypothetical protein